MNLIETKTDGAKLTIFFNGRIDSSNAAQAESLVEEARAANAHQAVILDMDNLEYISSAGLRIVLRLRKAESELCIVNASSDVYEIFEMTGFTEMMDIYKGYRKLSVDGCEVIGQGANGKVYRLDTDTIIKVYMNPDSLDDIKRERELARKAFVLGVPTAIPYDVVRVDDKYGSVFELLNAASFAKLVAANPADTSKYVDMSVSLLKKIHSTVVKPDDMPDAKVKAQRWVNDVSPLLPADKAAKLSDLVNAIPYSLNMLHGDYHVKNVMLQNGEALLIDMDTLCYGNPVFEFAGIFNAYKGFSEVSSESPEGFLGISKAAADMFWNRTLSEYLGTSDPEKLDQVSDKVKVISYMRLLRRFNRLGNAQAADHYREQLLTALDKVSSLAF